MAPHTAPETREESPPPMYPDQKIVGFYDPGYIRFPKMTPERFEEGLSLRIHTSDKRPFLQIGVEFMNLGTTMSRRALIPLAKCGRIEVTLSSFTDENGDLTDMAKHWRGIVLPQMLKPKKAKESDGTQKRNRYLNILIRDLPQAQIGFYGNRHDDMDHLTKEFMTFLSTSPLATDIEVVVGWESEHESDYGDINAFMRCCKDIITPRAPAKKAPAKKTAGADGKGNKEGQGKRKASQPPGQSKRLKQG